LIYPSLDELIRHVDSRYTLVIAAAKRARQILEENNENNEEQKEKAVSRALREIDAGKIMVERTKTGIK